MAKQRKITTAVRGTGKFENTTFIKLDCGHERSFGGMVLTHKWKKFETQTGNFEIAEGNHIPITIPSRKSYGGVLEHYRLMDYAAAQALRWALHARFDLGVVLSGTGLETRLVEHTLKYSFDCTPIAAHCHIHGNDRSSTMPDWGKKPPLTTEQRAKMGLRS